MSLISGSRPRYQSTSTCCLDGPPFPYLANQLGYAFATTSFRTNGLAVKDGVADIMDLLGEFKEQHPLKRTLAGLPVRRFGRRADRHQAIESSRRS